VIQSFLTPKLASAIAGGNGVSVGCTNRPVPWCPTVELQFLPLPPDATHNEHRLPFTQIPVALDLRWFNWVGPSFMVFGLLLVCVMAAMIGSKIPNSCFRSHRNA
jgi:hypothetical protein